MNLNDFVSMLAQAQAGKADAVWLLAEKRVAFEEENAALIESVNVLTETIKDLEQKVRTATLDAYTETGNKKPHPALGVRVTTSYVYDDDAAKRWALEHAVTNALKLDGKAFTAMVKAGAVPTEECAWTAEEKPTATIASDLSEYLPPAE